MNNRWQKALTHRVSSLWFALACLLLVSVLTAAKWKVDHISRITDRTLQTVTQPPPAHILRK